LSATKLAALTPGAGCKENRDGDLELIWIFLNKNEEKLYYAQYGENINEEKCTFYFFAFFRLRGALRQPS
jgi:hypothetical protein